MKQSWACEYCGETYFNKPLCAEHEKACSHNPENKTCDTCQNWFWDASGGKIDADGEPEGKSGCKIAGLSPFQWRCPCWRGE